jgi:hypothetical protein
MIVKESLNFERGIDPKESMNIGLEQTISKFMYENNYRDPLQWISYLTGAWEGVEDLDKETRIKWVNFLLFKSRKYIGKISLDEYDYNVMKELGIHWIPYIPIADDEFKYIQENEKYYLLFDGWENFSYYFEEDTKVNKEFVTKVLEGDAFEFFIYDEDYYKDIESFIWFLEKMNIPSFQKIKEKAIELGANSDNLNSVKNMFIEIDNNENLSELKTTILHSIADAQSSADESEAFNILKKLIKKHYEIGDDEEYYEKIKVPISFNGLEKFSYSVATGEEKIILYLPREISGDIDAETLNDSIYNQLEKLSD